MKKNKPHIYYCDRTLVHSPAYLGLCTSEKDFKAEIKRLKVKGKPYWKNHKLGATTHTFKHKGSGLCVIVCIEKIKKRSIEQTYAILAHEAVHVWQEIRAYLGEHNPSPEFEAYSVQNICEELFIAYRKSK